MFSSYVAGLVSMAISIAPSSTYLSHIAEEGDLAMSLDALTDRDLSIRDERRWRNREVAEVVNGMEGVCR